MKYDVRQFFYDVGKMMREFFNKDTNKMQRANMWTFSRFIISFIIPILALITLKLSSKILYVIIIMFTVFGVFTDFIDGRSARKYNSTSDFGKILDSITDKVFSIMISLCLSMFNKWFMIIILNEIIIAIVNYLYYLKYSCLKSTLVGKIKQWPLAVSFVLGFFEYLFPNISLIVLIFVIITCILQFLALFSYIFFYLKKSTS